MPDTFHPFMRLPYELRLEVWLILYEEPFTITLGYNNRTPTESCASRDLVSHSPLPLLQICKESRQVSWRRRNAWYLRVADAGFCASDPPLGVLVHFRPERDVLRFSEQYGSASEDTSARSGGAVWSCLTLPLLARMLPASFLAIVKNIEVPDCFWLYKLGAHNFSTLGFAIRQSSRNLLFVQLAEVYVSSAASVDDCLAARGFVDLYTKHGLPSPQVIVLE